MNASKVCLCSKVILSALDDQRSVPLNICDGANSQHSYSDTDEGAGPSSDSCVTQSNGYLALSEQRAALLRSRMATAATKDAQLLALPCPSNVVRACVAGTKYSVGKLKTQQQFIL